MVTQKNVEQFIQSFTGKMVSYVRVKYACPTFNPVVRVSFAERRTTSRGGIRRGNSFISIVAKRFLVAAQSTGMMDEPEYKSFNRDPVIGGLYNITWKKALASLLAHELGHAIQFDRGTKVGAKKVLGVENLDDRNEILRGHDWFWKQIYADLRVRFVNNEQFDLVQPVVRASAPVIPKAIPVEEIESATPSAGTLYVKYAYKGNSTITRFYINQKIAAVIVETNRQFFKADEFGENLEKLPFSSLVEARRFLIGQ